MISCIIGMCACSWLCGYLMAGRVREFRGWWREKQAEKRRLAYVAAQAKRIDPHAHAMYECGKIGTLRAPAKILHISVHRPEPTRDPGGGTPTKV